VQGLDHHYVSTYVPNYSKYVRVFGGKAKAKVALVGRLTPHPGETEPLKKIIPEGRRILGVLDCESNTHKYLAFCKFSEEFGQCPSPSCIIPHLLCLRNARAFPLLPAALASVPFGFVLVREHLWSADLLLCKRRGMLTRVTLHGSCSAAARGLAAA